MKHLLKHNFFNELLFQIVFITILFLMYAFSKHDNTVYWYDAIFFLSYVGISLLISYVLVPKFFYTKKLWLFWIGILIFLIAIFFIEEYILEPILVGGNRGKFVSNIFYTLLGIVPYVFMMVGFKLALDSRKNQQELKQLQLAIQESELRFLKSQINPHFLFNNLNNLYSYSIINSEKTSSIILELSSVLRYMLYNCKEKFVPLSKEINHLKNFTALNELQIEERGNINFNSNISSGNYCIAPLILTVFIENAFKHSMASLNENIKIDINVNVNNSGLLEFTSINNFLSISNNDNLSKGIGLENVKKRLSLIYPEEHNLHIEEREFTYEIKLNIQLKTAHQEC